MSLVETLKTKLTVSVLYIVEICLGEMMLTLFSVGQGTRAAC